MGVARPHTRAGGANRGEILQLAPWVTATGLPSMALAPISAGEQWLQPVDLAVRLAEKRLLLEAGAEVFACLPEGEAAAGLAAEYAAGCRNLRDAGLQLAEDLLVMQPDASGEYCLVAGSLHAPSYWRLGEKLGLPMTDIHRPVPELNARIGHRIRAFFERLPPDRCFLRSNWFLHPSGDLYQPDRREDWPDFTVENLGETLFLRCERQTLRRLPGSRALLFTVLSLTAPVSCVAGGRHAVELPAALARLHPALREEREVGRYESTLKRYLQTAG